MASHPDSLRDKLLCLKEDASALIIREYLLPYLDALQPHSLNNGERFVDQEQFFSLIRLLNRDRNADEAGERGGSVLSCFGGRAKADLTMSAQHEDTIWAYITDIAESIYGDEDALPIEEAPTGCIAFTTLRTIAALNIEGVVTGEAQREAIVDLIEEEVLRTGSGVISRSNFVLLLQRSQNRHPCLKSLDYEPLAFFLFPDRTMHASVVTQLVERTHRPPYQQSFLTDYCASRAATAGRLLDLMWQLPFFILFLLVVLTYRGLNAHAFDGRGVYEGVDQVIRAKTFPLCQFNDSLTAESNVTGSNDSSTSGIDASIASSWSCSTNEALRWDSVDSVDSLYSFLLGHTGKLIWNLELSNSTAANSNISNVLRVVGALKVRQVRVRAESDAPDVLLLDYFSGGLFGNGSAFDDAYDQRHLYRYGPYRSSKVDKSFIYLGNASTTAADDAGNGTSTENESSAPYTLLSTWDGSRYGSCSDLNGSRAFAKAVLPTLDKDYGCDGHAVIIPFNSSRDELNAAVTRLANGGWVDDRSTRAVIVEYHLFHPYSGFFVSVSHTIEFQAGGAVTNSLQVTPYYFADETSQATVSVVGYAIFVAYLAVLSLRLLGRVLLAKATLESNAAKAWAMFDFVNYIIFWAGVICRLAWYVHGEPGSSSPVWQLEWYPDGYDITAFYYRTFMTIEAFNVIITLLGLARYLSLVGTYSLVVATFSATAVSALTVGVLMVFVTFVFAVAGTIAFGSTVDGYQTVKDAALSLFNVFWGHLDVTTLQHDDMLFGFLFYAVFTIIAIGLLLTMYAAIFANTYMDLQTADAPICFDAVQSILAANSHHLLDAGTAATRIAGFPPLQVVIALFVRFLNVFKSQRKPSRRARQREADELKNSKSAPADGAEQPVYTSFHSRHRAAIDKYTFDVYDSRLKESLLDLLQPSGDAKIERGPASVAQRTQAAAELLVLIAQHVPVPTFDPLDSNAISSVTRNPFCSVFDFTRDVMGNHLDYTLTMCLYVIIPQQKFAQVGGYSLIAALREHRAWRDDVAGRSAQTSVGERLQLRVEVMLGAEEAADQDEIIKKAQLTSQRAGDVTLGQVPQAAPPGVEEAALVASLSHLNRRVFLGILSFAHDEHYDDEGNALSQERFEDIAYSLEGYPEARYSAANLWKDLGIDTWLLSRRRQEAERIRKTTNSKRSRRNFYSDGPAALPDAPPLYMRAFIPLFQQEFAAQCLGCVLDPEEVLEMDATLRKISNENARRIQVIGGAPINLREGSISQPLNVEGDTAPPSPNGTADGSYSYREEPSLPPSPNATVKPYVTKEQFEEAWLSVIQTKAPPRLVGRIFRLMPGGIMDPAFFTHFSRSNPLSSAASSLQGRVARAMQGQSSFAAWLTLYVPLLILLLYFLLVGYGMEESLHVSNGLEAALAPSPGQASSLEDVRNYLRTSIKTIWSNSSNTTYVSAATSDEVPVSFSSTTAAQPIHGNYPIGAIRIRQLRVRSDNRKRCDRIFRSYFGDDKARSITYPGTMSTSAMAFYASRIAVDYEDIINGACFSSYDRGDREKKLKLYNITTPSFVPNLGLRYTNTSGSTATAQFSSYHAGGFIMDLPVTTPSAEASSYLEELLLNYYVDRMTRLIVVEVVTYNPNLKMNAFGRFGYELTGGGALLPISEVTVARHDKYKSSVFIVCSVLIWIMLALYATLLSLEVAHYVRTDENLYLHNTLGATMKSFWYHPWHFVDVFVIAGFAVSWGWRLDVIGHSDMPSISNLIPFSETTFVESANPSYAGLSLGHYPSDIEKDCVYMRTIRYVEAALVIFAFARLYSILANWGPIRTQYQIYSTAARELVALLALLLVVLVGFALAAMLLFGYSVESFFRFEFAYAEVFSTALLQWGGRSATVFADKDTSYVRSYSTGFAEAFAKHPDSAIIFQILLVSTTVFVIFGMAIAVLTGATSAVIDNIFDEDQIDEILTSETNAMNILYDQYYEDSSSSSSDEDDGDDSDGSPTSKGARRQEQKAYSALRRLHKHRSVGGLVSNAFGWLLTSAIVREPVQLYFTIRLSLGLTDSRRDAISKVYCSSERAMWASMAGWWADVDTQPPGRATLSGISLLQLAREVREANERAYQRHNEAVGGAQGRAIRRESRRLSTLVQGAGPTPAIQGNSPQPAITDKSELDRIEVLNASNVPAEGPQGHPADFGRGNVYSGETRPADNTAASIEVSESACSPSALMCRGDDDLIATPIQPERSPQLQHPNAIESEALTNSLPVAPSEAEASRRLSMMDEAAAVNHSTPDRRASVRSTKSLKADPVGINTTAVAEASTTPPSTVGSRRPSVLPVGQNNNGLVAVVVESPQVLAVGLPSLIVTAPPQQPSQSSRRRVRAHLADCDGEDPIVLALEAENDRIMRGLPTLPSANRYSLHGAPPSAEQGDQQQFTVAAPLETYGTDRRVLSWAELLYNTFGKDYGAMHRHLVSTPSGVRALWYAPAEEDGEAEARLAAQNGVDPSQPGQPPQLHTRHINTVPQPYPSKSKAKPSLLSRISSAFRATAASAADPTTKDKDLWRKAIVINAAHKAALKPTRMGTATTADAQANLPVSGATYGMSEEDQIVLELVNRLPAAVSDEAPCAMSRNLKNKERQRRRRAIVKAEAMQRRRQREEAMRKAAEAEESASRQTSRRKLANKPRTMDADELGQSASVLNSSMYSNSSAGSPRSKSRPSYEQPTIASSQKRHSSAKPFADPVAMSDYSDSARPKGSRFERSTNRSPSRSRNSVADGDQPPRSSRPTSAKRAKATQRPNSPERYKQHRDNAEGFDPMYAEAETERRRRVLKEREEAAAQEANAFSEGAAATDAEDMPLEASQIPKRSKAARTSRKDGSALADPTGGNAVDENAESSDGSIEALRASLYSTATSKKGSPNINNGLQRQYSGYNINADNHLSPMLESEMGSDEDNENAEAVPKSQPPEAVATEGQDKDTIAVVDRPSEVVAASVPQSAMRRGANRASVASRRGKKGVVTVVPPTGQIVVPRDELDDTLPPSESKAGQTLLHLTAAVSGFASDNPPHPLGRGPIYRGPSRKEREAEELRKRQLNMSSTGVDTEGLNSDQSKEEGQRGTDAVGTQGATQSPGLLTAANIAAGSAVGAGSRRGSSLAASKNTAKDGLQGSSNGLNKPGSSSSLKNGLSRDGKGLGDENDDGAMGPNGKRKSFNNSRGVDGHDDAVFGNVDENGNPVPPKDGTVSAHGSRRTSRRSSTKAMNASQSNLSASKAAHESIIAEANESSQLVGENGATDPTTTADAAQRTSATGSRMGSRSASRRGSKPDNSADAHDANKARASKNGSGATEGGTGVEGDGAAGAQIDADGNPISPQATGEPNALDIIRESNQDMDEGEGRGLAAAEAAEAAAADAVSAARRRAARSRQMADGVENALDEEEGEEDEEGDDDEEEEDQESQQHNNEFGHSASSTNRGDGGELRGGELALLQNDDGYPHPHDPSDPTNGSAIARGTPNRRRKKGTRRNGSFQANAANDPEDDYDGVGGRARSSSRQRRPPRSNSGRGAADFNPNGSNASRRSRPGTPGGEAGVSGDRRGTPQRGTLGSSSPQRSNSSHSPNGSYRKRDSSPNQQRLPPGQYYPDDYLSPKERHNHWLPSGRAEIPDLRRMIIEREELTRKSLVADGYGPSPNSGSNAASPSSHRSRPQSPAPSYGV